MRKCKKIFTLLAILWMAAIFFFSSRNADESTAQSNRAGMLAGHLFVRDFDSWTEQEQLDFAKKIDHPVRKTAHASEYALLGMLLFGAMTGTRKIRMGYAWLAASCYAATDEFHQLFVPGRSCQFTDVCIDSGGAALGILVAAGVSLLVFRIREWRSQNL
ncbi:MAG: VanZ family protein [Bilifractor porci]|jgi:VanZ family protein